jgi:hypothetical protein
MCRYLRNRLELLCLDKIGELDLMDQALPRVGKSKADPSRGPPATVTSPTKQDLNLSGSGRGYAGTLNAADHGVVCVWRCRRVLPGVRQI